MSSSSEQSVSLSYTPASSLTAGLHVYAALGGGPAHLFEIDTGSVGVLAPRKRLGPDYQDFDPSLDKTFSYVSSGKTYWGQWVKLNVVLGVPEAWDGTGDYPTAEIKVFAVDRPTDFDGGILGVGFAIGEHADGGPARNPFLHARFQGAPLGGGYILGADRLELGLTDQNTAGFAFLDLQRNDADTDWAQPMATLAVGDNFAVDLPLLIDTGVEEMILWLAEADRPSSPNNASPLPAGVSVKINAPPAASAPALSYQFVVGDASNPAAPSEVDWRDGTGINTGRKILAAADYLYDHTLGRIGFRKSLGPSAIR